jgi:phosphoglucomutase
MDNAVQLKINQWLEGNYDEQTKEAIQSLITSGKEEDLIDCFYKDLEFGTGGLRGLMGVGTNRMNKYTIGAATQGLANYLFKTYPDQDLSIAVAHDSRNNSPEFAQIVADVFSANGIKVYFFEALRPTPELSFAVRHFGCQSGIVLTASHNPKEYNGYKAYWNDGAQMIAPHDTNTIDEVNAISSVDDIKFNGNPSLIQKIGVEIDELYLSSIQSLSVSPEIIKKQHDLNIVYSSIHGTGITLVPEVLKKFGFTNVNIVEEQAEPDGNFPTVVYPNPEEAEALSLALKKGNATNAELIMATDPDADRVGIAVRDLNNEFILLNGNQTGALLIDYMLNAWADNNKLKGKEFIVKTIVTSELLKEIADSFNTVCFDTLTGFKYIAGKIKELEGDMKFIAGGEESYGYLVGDFVRDKDAIASCAFIAEMAAYAKEKGFSLYEKLIDIYVKHGYYKEKLISLTKKGKSGSEEIQLMMKTLRENPPKQLGGAQVVEVKDYLSAQSTNLISGAKTTIDLPKENVLQLITADGTKISARPSGTEPKIKFYFSVKETLADKKSFDAVTTKLDNKIARIVDELELSK